MTAKKLSCQYLLNYKRACGKDSHHLYDKNVMDNSGDGWFRVWVCGEHLGYPTGLHHTKE